MLAVQGMPTEIAEQQEGHGVDAHGQDGSRRRWECTPCPNHRSQEDIETVPNERESSGQRNANIRSKKASRHAGCSASVIIENDSALDREARGSRLETPLVGPSYVTLRPMPDGYGGIHK